MHGFLAYDRVNYSRFLTVYLAEMRNLPSKHPAAHQVLYAGEFVVQQRAKIFSQSAIDQTIKQTVNRSTKSKGGIIGYSLNRLGAVCRWHMNVHRSTYVGTMQTLYQANQLLRIATSVDSNEMRKT